MKARIYSIIPRTGFTEREVKRALKRKALAKRKRNARKRAKNRVLSFLCDKRYHTDVICDVPEMGFYFSAEQAGLEFNSCSKAVAYVRRRFNRFAKNNGIDTVFEFDHDFDRASRIVHVILKRQGLPEKLPKIFGGQSVTQEVLRNRRTA